MTPNIEGHSYPFFPRPGLMWYSVDFLIPTPSGRRMGHLGLKETIMDFP
jgi:hypothetical protein